MLGSLPILALAALTGVQASPLQARQATTAAAASSASNAVVSAISGASAMTSAMSSAATSTAAAPAASTTAANVTTGNQTYSMYPCPEGYLLTYFSANMTLPVPVSRAVAAYGNWSSSPTFPNLTAVMGASAVGASHVITVGGSPLHEMLVNVTPGGASGSVIYTWNLTSGPFTDAGVGISNYSTVFEIYDPGYASTNMTGTNTTALIYTNACASNQTSGATLIGILGSLELGTFASLVSNSTAASAPVASAATTTTRATSSATTSATRVSTSAVSTTAAAAGSSVSSRATSVAAPAVTITSTA